MAPPADQPNRLIPGTPSTPALQATDLRRTYTTRDQTTVGVHGISLSINRGETLALLGPNGAGKSTLLGMLATIDPPHEGTLTIDGIAIDRHTSNARRTAARARLGVAFQTHALDPLLTVRENLRIAAALHSLPDRDAPIDQAMQTLRVRDRADDRVGTLSGGLARRADLARAMLHRPAVLLLDEPTTGLDPEARADLLDTLAQLANAPDAPAILLSTHLTDEAEHADTVAIVVEGRIAAAGSPDSLRATLGDRIITLDHDPRTTNAQPPNSPPNCPTNSPPSPADLRDLGLSILSAEPRRTVAAAPNHQTAARAATALLDRSLRFRVGPPALADVYASVVANTSAHAAHDNTPNVPTEGTRS